jgi:hypothetical protein
LDGSGKLDSSAHLGEGDTLRKIREKMEAKRKEREIVDRARAARVLRRDSGELKEAKESGHSPRMRLLRDSRQVFAEDRDAEPTAIPVSPRRGTVLKEETKKEEKPVEAFASPRKSGNAKEKPIDAFASPRKSGNAKEEPKVEDAPPSPIASPSVSRGGWFASIASSVASTVASAASAIRPTPAPAPVAVIEDHFLQNKSRVAMEEIKETLHLEGKLDKILDIIMVQSQVVDAIELGARKRIVDLERKVVELEKELHDLKAQTIKL